jgi:hypothetical protein
VQLIILFLPNFKDNWEVLLHEMIFTELRPLHFLVLTSDHHVLLHLPAWGDFLLYHEAVVTIHWVLWIDFFGGQKTSGKRSALTRWWRFLFSWEISMDGVRGGRRRHQRPLAIVPGARDTRNNESQLGGGKYTTPGEGDVVQHTSPRLPPFSFHGGKNGKAEGRGQRDGWKVLGRAQESRSAGEIAKENAEKYLVRFGE